MRHEKHCDPEELDFIREIIAYPAKSFLVGVRSSEFHFLQRYNLSMQQFSGDSVSALSG